MKGLWYILSRTFSNVIYAQQNRVSVVFSISKELNNVCGERRRAPASETVCNGIIGKKSEAWLTYKTGPFSANVIPVQNWSSAFRLPAEADPSRTQPLYCFTWRGSAQRDLHIYHRNVFTKKLACDWAGKLQRAPTVRVSMRFSQKIYFQFVIHKGRARDWDGVLWSGKQSLLFSLQLNRIHMTQAWHGGLLSCNVLLVIWLS